MPSPERTESAGTAVELKRPVEIEELRTIFHASIGGVYLNQRTVNDITGPDGHKFQPIQVNPIRVVKVKTAEGIQLLIQDGHHTADGILRMNDKFATVYHDVIAEFNSKYSTDENGWQPTIIDVTTNYLTTPSPMKKQPHLTMRQYLEIVTPYTVTQSAVLRERAGLYAMNYWPSIADEELSSKLSSFATLVLLASDEHQRITTENELATLLRQDTHFFATATYPQKERYIDSICTMWRFIQGLETPIDRVLEFAQQLLLRDPDKIGGKQKAKEHFAGTSALPSVRRKVGTATELALRHALKRNFDRLASKSPSSANSHITNLIKAMQDPDINQSELGVIIEAESPSKRYEIISTLNETNKHIRTYQELPNIQGRQLRREEELLLRRRIPFSTVQSAMRAIDRADSMMPELPADKQETIAQLRSHVVNSNTPQRIRDVIRKLERQLRDPSPDHSVASSQEQDTKDTPQPDAVTDTRLHDLIVELDQYKAENTRLILELDAVRRELAAAQQGKPTQYTPEAKWYMDKDAMKRSLEPRELAVADACRRGLFQGVINQYGYNGEADIRQAYQKIIDEVYIPPQKRQSGGTIYPSKEE